MNEVCYRTTLETPLGPMLAVATDRGLCGLEFEIARRQSMLEARFRRWYRFNGEVKGDGCAALDVTAAWLRAYFDGHGDAVLPPLDARGTKFEEAVWRAMLTIPYGRTESYASLAQRVGRPNGARAVGGGVGRNPLGILVPCHRVVGTDGSMTGYGGGLSRKTWLLAHEAGRG